MFSDMDMCEQLGSGMKKILKTYPASIFDISEHFISAKFDYEKEALQVLEIQTVQNEPVKLTKSADRVLNCLIVNPNATINVLMSEIGVARETVKRALKFLRDNGYIKRRGSDKAGYYEILKHS